MRFVFLVVTFMFLMSFLGTGCSTPKSDTSKYFPENSENASIVEDITGSGTENASAVDDEEPVNPIERYKTDVSPGNIPKLETQYNATMYLLEKTREEFKESKVPDYKFAINHKAFVNGNPLLGEVEITSPVSDEAADSVASEDITSDSEPDAVIGEVSPVPFFKTWDFSKITSISDVDSWAQHAVSVKILGIRKNEYGNWYQVEVVQGGLVPIKGWVNEIFLSATSGAKKEGFESATGVLEDRGGRRGR